MDKGVEKEERGTETKVAECDMMEGKVIQK